MVMDAAALVARLGRNRRQVFPARPRRISPSFTDAEHGEVLAAASRAGLTPTGYSAVATLAAARGEAGTGPAVREQVEALAQLQAELFDARTAVVRTGTNLNQAVAALNATGEAPVWLAHAVQRCTRALTVMDELAAWVHRRVR